ncbi:hypothetical protein [Bradyrhizobium sp. 21]|uniref:hypothetical protein n=1 Tax=Bradyrhizobium sp. 21 TaxID=2782666 RepID=UPI001FFAD64D|nr:hypothetical protein [Bradyrhizobium sp. 21]MCK1385759.1 hypothetical protein [Bradyrhizobium sp. 21]
MRHISLFVCTVIAALTNCSSVQADDCHSPTETSFTPGKLTSSLDWAGQLYWLPNGLEGASLLPLYGCVRIPFDRSRLVFAIGNAIVPITDSEQRTFVSIQVAKLQDSKQDTRLKISRFGEWMRGSDVLPTIDDQKINISVSSFFLIHEGMTVEKPSDDDIKYIGKHWHGLPTNGVYPSFGFGPQFSSQDIKTFANNENVILSNRLQEMVTSPKNRKLLWFNVGTDGTKAILIRTFSPNRSPFEQAVRVVPALP